MVWRCCCVRNVCAVVGGCKLHQTLIPVSVNVAHLTKFLLCLLICFHSNGSTMTGHRENQNF